MSKNFKKKTIDELNKIQTKQALINDGLNDLDSFLLPDLPGLDISFDDIPGLDFDPEIFRDTEFEKLLNEPIPGLMDLGLSDEPKTEKKKSRRDKQDT